MKTSSFACIDVLILLLIIIITLTIFVIKTVALIALWCVCLQRMRDAPTIRRAPDSRWWTTWSDSHRYAGHRPPSLVWFSCFAFFIPFLLLLLFFVTRAGLQSRRVRRLSGLRGHTQARRLRVQCPAELGVQEQIRHVPEGRVRAVGIAGVGRPHQ